ncbi:energy transducer TonB [Phaeocystidibacter luteus]|uniref:Energy transducer TonB n=1 Tax=Phaeocystidibacter luteus TaxID=911197 RepID=A0A6N6RH43_9FLAO|nr:energy transducer TonB [Phaeocystidibacter luteus]KAB2810072.1 energy transducer TonB [Phaeocystidibacter luteus]
MLNNLRSYILTIALSVLSLVGYSTNPEDCLTLSDYLEIQFRGTPETQFDRSALEASVGSIGKRRFRSSFADTIISYVPVSWTITTDDNDQDFVVQTSPTLGIIVEISSKDNPCIHELIKDLESRDIEPVEGVAVSYRETDDGGAKPNVMSEIELYEIEEQYVEVYHKEDETQLLIYSKSRYNAVFGEERNRTYPEIEEVVNFADTYDFYGVESYPRFPGCDQKSQDENYYCFEYNVRKVIGANFDFPEDAVRESRGGVVYIQFIIEYDGSISEITVIRSSGHDDIDQAGIDAARHLPKMTPAKVNGQPVRMSYVVPINARISSNDED